MKAISLSAWKTEDAQELAILANNRLVAQFMADSFPFPYQLSDAENFIKWSTQNCPSLIKAIRFQDKLIGGIGIHPQQDIMRKNAEIGYWIAEPYWNKGFATAAILQITVLAFEHYPINRIFARTFGNNIASQKALQKAGYKQEGFYEKTIFKDGQFFDEIIFAQRRPTNV